MPDFWAGRPSTHQTTTNRGSHSHQAVRAHEGLLLRRQSISMNYMSWESQGFMEEHAWLEGWRSRNPSQEGFWVMS